MDCRVPILMYHSIADDGPAKLAPYRVSTDAFRRQMLFLREHGYNSISLTEWAFSIATKRFIPGHPVVITFDDGYADFVSNAWPILAETGLRATVFVVTGKVGGVADWDKTGERRADPVGLGSTAPAAATRQLDRQPLCDPPRIDGSFRSRNRSGLRRGARCVAARTRCRGDLPVLPLGDQRRSGPPDLRRKRLPVGCRRHAGGKRAWRRSDEPAAH